MPKSDIHYAGFGPRLLAFLVDALIGTVLPMVMAFAVTGTLTWSGLWVPASTIDLVAMWNSMGWTHRLVVIVAFNLHQGLLYFPLCHSSPWQATVGKRWRHLIVTDRDGAGVSFLRALGRALVKTWFGNILQGFGLAIQIASVLATKRHQAIHDLLAKSVVVRGRSPAGAQLGYWRVAVFLLVPPVFFLAVFILMLALGDSP